IPDGLEVSKGCNPLASDLPTCVPRVLQTLTVSPSTFSITVNAVNPIAFQQLAVKGLLIDGKTVLDLTSNSTGTNYTSSNLSVCTLDVVHGLVFAAANGSCTITVTNGSFSGISTGTVNAFSPIQVSMLNIDGSVAVDVGGSFAYVGLGPAGITV